MYDAAAIARKPCCKRTMPCIKGCRSGQGVRGKLLTARDITGKYEHTKMSQVFRPAAATQSSRLKNYKTETPYKQWRRAFQNFLEAMLCAVRDRYVQYLGSLLASQIFPASVFHQVFFFFFFEIPYSSMSRPKQHLFPMVSGSNKKYLIMLFLMQVITI